MKNSIVLTIVLLKALALLSGTIRHCYIGFVTFSIESAGE